MNELVRDSSFGQIVRFAFSARYFRYLEESTDFVLPSKYDHSKHNADEISSEHAEEKDSGQGAEENLDSKENEKDVVIVDWYSEDDPENPHNWNRPRKAWTTFAIVLYSKSR